MAEYLVGLLGEGIRHSLTPPMHVAEAEHLGISYEYRALDLLEMTEDASHTSEIILRARDEGYAALNVTHPCKQLALEVLDELSPEAARLQAVNLVSFRDGKIIGQNTDWTGFRAAVQEGLPDALLDTVVQVGAGGAGAATAYALLTLGVRHLMLSDHDITRAVDLAHTYQTWFPYQRITVVPATSLDEGLSDCEGVVNATPMGMFYHPGVSFDIEALNRDAWVCEIVYLPIETELLRTARRAGHRVLDGGRMAVGQAADSIEYITGRTPNRDRMRAHFLELVSSQQPMLPQG